jgi:hypothetical protein
MNAPLDFRHCLTFKQVTKTRLFNCAPQRKLLPEGEKCEPGDGLSAAAFLKDLNERVNSPFQFKPLGNLRHFGIND